MKKSLLIICKQAPWSGVKAKETLDLALSGGAFDLPIALLFLDDGIFQLVTAQQPTTLEQKDICAQLKALPLFGIDQLFVAEHCLTERGLSIDQLHSTITPLDKTQLATTFKNYDQVIVL